MNTLPTIQSLWIGKQLSVMERLSITSFLQYGHPFHLYAYDDVGETPTGTIIMDGGAILPPDKIFKYRDYNSYAGFSNAFRYKLLLEKGSYWVDTDIICLKPFSDQSEYVFASQRRGIPLSEHKSSKGIYSAIEGLAARARRFINHFLSLGCRIASNCVIKSPSNSAIMDYCYRESIGKDPDWLRWGETGPELLGKAITKFGMWRYVAAPNDFCPIDWWNWRRILDERPADEVLSRSQAVHLWNEMWRRNDVDKSGSFSERSVYEQLKKAYLK